MPGDFWTGGIEDVSSDATPGGYVAPTGLTENFKTAYDANIYGASQQSARAAFDDFEPEIRSQRDARIVELTGKQMPADFEGYQRTVREVQAQFPDEKLDDRFIAEGVYEKVRSLNATADATAANSTTSGALGSFLGGTVAAFNPRVNPLNVATLPLGWGKTAVQRILANTAIGGASEALNQFTGVAAWRKEAGLQTTPLESLNQIGYAAVGGGALSAGGELLAAGLGRLAGKTLPQLEKMREGKQLSAAETAVLDGVQERIRVQEFGQVPDDQALALAQKWMAEARGTSDDRAAVHALDEAIETQRTNPYDTQQPGAVMQHEGRLQDTIDRISDGQLADDPPAMLPRTGADDFIGKQPTDELIDVQDLVLDPGRFQFKSGTDASGANETLKKISAWNPQLAGTITVFEDAAGKRFVADGHQRVNLAQRLLAEGKEKGIRVRANVLREGELANSPLGNDFRWTPESANAYAASINMVQGTGSILDASKVLRYRPEYLTEMADNALTRNAQGLSRLSDDAFSMVVNNSNVNEAYAAIVGRLVDEPKLHAPILKQLTDSEPENLFQAESIVRQMRDEAFDTRVQETLFGAEETVESLFKPKAKVLDRALRILRDDKKLFATLAQNVQKIEGTGANRLDNSANANTLNNVQMALHNVQTLAYRKGDISDALTAAARKAQQNGNFAASAREFAESIRQSVARGDLDGGTGGVVADAVPARAAQSQSEDLVATGGRSIEAKLDLNTDALARESGLTPERAESVDLADDMDSSVFDRPDSTARVTTAEGGAPEGVTGVVIPDDAVHPRKGLHYNQALEQMMERPMTLGEDSRAAFDAAPAKRKKLREKILNDLYGTGAAKKERRMDLIIGPPGAGKSSVIAGKLVKEHGAIEIDSDIIKTKLPEFDDGIGANAVHLESSYIAEDWLHRAIENGDNIVHPIVGKSATKVRKLIDDMNEMGYKVNVFLVDLPAKSSAERVVARYKSTGRLLPPSYVLSIGDAPRRTYQEVIQKGVNEHAHFDNNVPNGAAPRLVGTNRPDLYGEPGGRTGGADGPDVRPGRGPGDRGAGADQGPSAGGRETSDTETSRNLTGPEYDREIPIGIDIDPNTGETIARTMTLRELAEMVADDDALAKASRECAL